MASVHFPVAITKMATGDLDLTDAGTDIECLLCMTANTCEADFGADNLGAISDMDEFDGANYVRKDLDNITATDDGTTFTFDNTADVTWTTLEAGTRSIDGVLVFQNVGGVDANSIPIAYLEVTDTAANGGDITIAFNASGILTIA
jgi:hypothetical protein